MTDQLTHLADTLRRAHQARHGITNPVPWHALKPSEKRMWQQQAINALSQAAHTPADLEEDTPQ